MIDRHIFTVQSFCDVETLINNYDKCFLYGCGDVAELIWKNHKHYLKKKNVKFVKSVANDGEMFHGNNVYSFEKIQSDITESCIFVIAAHEETGMEILNLILKRGKTINILLLDERIIYLEKMEVIKQRIKRGILSVYFQDIQNMGDQLNVYLLKKLFGYQTVKENVAHCDLVCIGSALDDFFYKNEGEKIDTIEQCACVNVWGMGFCNDLELDQMNCIRKLNIAAVRGVHTQKKLCHYYGTEINCPVGDPGLLTKLVVDKTVEKKYKIGIIPHFREQHLYKIKEIYDEYNNALVINLRNDVGLVIEQIRECELIISSSLHGCVVSDSLGIPNLLVKISDIPYGDGFKYRDYYSAYGLKKDRFDLKDSGIPSTGFIRSQYSISWSRVMEIQKALIESFPYADMTL